MKVYQTKSNLRLVYFDPEKLEPEKDIIWWSPTKLEAATSCLKRFYFQYIKKEKVSIPGYMALGTFIHSKMESLYDGEFGNLHVKFKSAESFVNSSVGQWKRIIIKEGKIQGNKIDWKDKNEPWTFIPVIRDLCLKAYQKYLDEGTPLKVELPIRFEFGEHYYNLKVDELRKGAIIRDHKTGRFFEDKFSLNYKPQLTMYALAISCLAYLDRNFAEIFGIKEPEKLAGNPNIISPEIKVEYYHMRSNTIIQTERTDAHYYELSQNLNDLESRIRSGIFPVNRYECARCLYQKVCDQTTAATIYPKKEDPQLNMFVIKEKVKEKKKQTYLRFSK